MQDLEYVKKLGKRIKDAGMTFMLDFHYSDTWADPTKQTIPAAWQSIAQGQPMADKVYAYTKECLTALVAAGATPDFIQVGNEISYGMLWSSKGRDMVAPNSPYEDYQANWEKLSLYLNAGARACREVCPQAKIVIHIERTTSATQCVNFFNYIGRSQFASDPMFRGSVSDVRVYNFAADAEEVRVIYEGGEPTSVRIVGALPESAPADVTDAPAYDLAGRRALRTQKGYVITNGKKYLNR